MFKVDRVCGHTVTPFSFIFKKIWSYINKTFKYLIEDIPLVNRYIIPDRLGLALDLHVRMACYNDRVECTEVAYVAQWKMTGVFGLCYMPCGNRNCNNKVYYNFGRFLQLQLLVVNRNCNNRNCNKKVLQYRSVITISVASIPKESSLGHKFQSLCTTEGSET